jgi:hypothetical protein
MPLPGGQEDEMGEKGSFEAKAKTDRQRQEPADKHRRRFLLAGNPRQF